MPLPIVKDQGLSDLDFDRRPNDIYRTKNKKHIQKTHTFVQQSKRQRSSEHTYKHMKTCLFEMRFIYTNIIKNKNDINLNWHYISTSQVVRNRTTKWVSSIFDRAGAKIN